MDKKNALSGGLELTALRGSEVIKHKDSEGLFIPFRSNGLQRIISKKGNKIKAFLNIFIQPYKDNYGNDYMVSRSRTEKEATEKAYTELLGNIRTVKKSVNTTPDVEEPPRSQPQKNNEEDPF